ncbi:ABC transporter permease [Roseivirga sp.]|uniref:ABC transporter permease n=1 Tax=Roseivirga sp. TaxID=1964215 RepID=UPI003B51E7D9
MLKSFLLISVRSLWSKGGSTLLNMIGLALGIASCLFISNFIFYELSFDKFHEKSDRIFRLETESYHIQEKTGTDAFSLYRAAPELAAKHKGIENYFRLTPFSENQSAFLISEDSDNRRTSFTEAAYYTDAAIFEILNIELTEQIEQPLTRPNQISISEEMAFKMFPNKLSNGNSVIGEIVHNRSADLSNSAFEIVAIFKSLPENSHIQFDVLFSNIDQELLLDMPGYHNTYAYVLLTNGADHDIINQDLWQETSNKSDNQAYYHNTSLYPLVDIHLGHKVSNPPAPTTDPSLLLFLGVIGFIVLLLSATTYINNSIITALDRAKETGIRKLLGVTPGQLRMNIFLECLLTNLTAGILALLLFFIGQKSARVFLEIGYPSSIDGTRILILSLTSIGLILLGTFFTAFYPSHLLNSLKLTDALKGKNIVFQSKQSSKGARAMKTLLIFQLTMSMIFISAAYVVYSQLKYVKEHDSRQFELEVKGKFPGFAGANEVYTNYTYNFINKALENEQVKSVSLSNLFNGQVKKRQYIKPLRQLDKDSSSYEGQFLLSLIDYSYWAEDSTIFISGENFSSLVGEDFNGVIINESALKAMKFESASEAIGSRVGKYNGPLVVKGVIKNKTANEGPEVYVTGLRFPTYFYITVEIEGNTAEKINIALDGLRRKWDPQFHNFYIITRNFENQSALEQSLLRLFILFTGIAIFVACMGIYSLSAFTAQKRTKEIGLRKILGANVSHILFLLIYDFLQLIFYGCIISIPLILLGARNWLENYTYRIQLHPVLLIIPILTMTLIAVVIIVRQSWQTVVVRPLGAISR